MAIEFTKKPIDWDNAGITPPQDLIERGFQPGYKPPAEYFNALLHTTSEAIKELQEKAVELSNTVDEGGGAAEHTDSATPHITDAACTYASGVYTLTPSKAVGNASYFCLRFKAPNDYAASASFKIGTKTYTAVNAAFKQNDVVILNFDVSQSKCFFVSGGKTYGVATTTSDGLMSAEDKTKLNGLNNNGAGRKVEGQTFYINNSPVTAGEGAEIFNKYDEGNIATGRYSVAMGSDSKAKGNASFAMGDNTIANGFASVAMGFFTTANGECSFAMGNNTTANGKYSVATGCQTTADYEGAIAMGFNSTASNLHSVAIGCGVKSTGIYSTAMGFFTTANSVNTAMGRHNKIPTGAGTDDSKGDLFIIGNGSSSSNSNAFRITAAGDVMGTKSYSASGADYAEMFEWTDGNPDNEDRRGLFVTLDGEKIRPANSDDDYILGVVSATPSVVADAQTDDWGKKWKTDIFGERLLDENGAWILNEGFREEDNESYVSRLDRKEWAAVGLVGKLIAVDDGTCEVNGYCKPVVGGKAAKAETGYRVLSRLDENHIKILVK